MAIERHSDQITVAHLSGDAQIIDDLQTLSENIAAHPTNLILDFAGVRYVTSSHIAKLLKLRMKLTIAAERRLILCAVHPQAWTTFTVTGLDKIYEFADTFPAALALLHAA